ncbi:hypothetical protein D623_10022975 [Myotis brandtii]|uniref:Uncharacterized protein n=1 Tax=Myotis brandtii TaxID=109478 RepID=S7PML0_MYOBR|nr:hypothetical protein D623_10022975 [Myotis brandtii]
MGMRTSPHCLVPPEMLIVHPQLSGTRSPPTGEGPAPTWKSWNKSIIFPPSPPGLGVKTTFSLWRDSSEEYQKFLKGEAAQ